MSSEEAHSKFEHQDLHNLAVSSTKIRTAFNDDKYICSTRNDDHAVDILRIGSEACQILTPKSFSNADQLSSYLSKAKRCQKHPSVDFVFIHQKYTWAALNISKAMIAILMDHYHLSAGFLNNLFAFRDRIYPTEEAFSGAVQSMVSNDRSELGYVFKYPECKNVEFGKPWRMRHTGVSHTHDYSESTSAFIIISPYPNARFAEYMKQSLQDSKVRAMLLANPMLVHPMLLSTHFNTWRDYLEYQETELIETEMRAECAALNEPLVSFETLKRVRSIEKDLLPIEPLLKSFGKLILELNAGNFLLNKTYGRSEMAVEAVESALSGFQRECSSYREHASYLSKRSQSTAQSVSDTLSLYFQQLGQGQSENTFILAQSAREDSVAIKVLTLVTSCYLPFSFVATMLGMNLVAFDQDTHNLMVSNQFWLYFVLSVPLMAVTLALCKWGLWRHSRSRTSMPIEPRKDGYELDDLV